MDVLQASSLKIYLLCCVGMVHQDLGSQKNKASWWGKPALWRGCSRTGRRQEGRRDGSWKLSWTASLILYILSWGSTGACSATDSYSHVLFLANSHQTPQCHITQYLQPPLTVTQTHTTNSKTVFPLRVRKHTDALLYNFSPFCTILFLDNSCAAVSIHFCISSPSVIFAPFHSHYIKITHPSVRETSPSSWEE